MDNPVCTSPRSTLAIRAFVAGRALAIVIAVELALTPRLHADEPAPKPAWQRLLQGDDAKRAAELNTAIAAALKADRWNDAIARAEELLALRSRVQGPKHFETIDDEWRLKAFRQVGPMSHDDRLAYQASRIKYVQALDFYNKGKHAEAEAQFEQALEIRRRLLTDENPETAEVYDNLAVNLQRMPIEDVPKC